MTTEIRSGVSGGGGKGLASTSYDGHSGVVEYVLCHDCGDHCTIAYIGKN